MSYAYKKKSDGPWYIGYTDFNGVALQRKSSARTKKEAEGLARDEEIKHEKIRLGHLPKPLPGQEKTFGELMTWWNEGHGKTLKSQTIIQMANARLRPKFGDIKATELTAGAIAGYFDELLAKEELSKASINHLRNYVRRVYNLAIERDHWAGENPARGVKPQRLGKKKPLLLKVWQLPQAMGQMTRQNRNLTATTAFLALRRGELLKLWWPSVDLPDRKMTLVDTKNGNDYELPIPELLVPFLEDQLALTGGHGPVFPTEDGEQQPSDANLTEMLRKACADAGIVAGWSYACRRKGCGGKSEAPAGPKPGRVACDRCGFQMTPVAKRLPVLFHKLRHLTATLLHKAGAPLKVIQAILRHADLATTETYIHGGDFEEIQEALALNPIRLDGLVSGLFQSLTRDLPEGDPRKVEGPDLSVSASDQALQWSGRRDSNSRPLAPQGSSGATAGPSGTKETQENQGDTALSESDEQDEDHLVRPRSLTRHLPARRPVRRCLPMRSRRVPRQVHDWAARCRGAGLGVAA